MNFTVVYDERWQSGSRIHSITKIARIVLYPNENVGDMLTRLNIPSPRFIFQGWPLLEGETHVEHFILHTPLPPIL